MSDTTDTSDFKKTDLAFRPPAAPQRGEVGEEARAWLKNAIQHAQFWGSPIVANHLETIEAALSRPPVVAETEAEEKLLFTAANIGGRNVTMERMDNVLFLLQLCKELAAERALAVPPQEGSKS